MRTTTNTTTAEAPEVVHEGIGAEAAADAANEPKAEGEARSVPQDLLRSLMQKALAGRRRMTEAQARLRDMESEMRSVDGEKRSRFERLRAAALDEYRKARADAERARRQLHTNLRLLPGRS